MTADMLVFFIFVLSIFLGFELISKVPSMLHTPLMSGTNTIHGIILLGDQAFVHLGQEELRPPPRPGAPAAPAPRRGPRGAHRRALIPRGRTGRRGCRPFRYGSTGPGIRAAQWKWQASRSASAHAHHAGLVALPVAVLLGGASYRISVNKAYTLVSYLSGTK